jgi:hypothetical protein
LNKLFFVAQNYTKKYLKRPSREVVCILKPHYLAVFVKCLFYHKSPIDRVSSAKSLEPSHQFEYKTFYQLDQETFYQLELGTFISLNVKPRKIAHGTISD